MLNYANTTTSLRRCHHADPSRPRTRLRRHRLRVRLRARRHRRRAERRHRPGHAGHQRQHARRPRRRRGRRADQGHDGLRRAERYRRVSHDVQPVAHGLRRPDRLSGPAEPLALKMIAGDAMNSIDVRAANAWAGSPYTWKCVSPSLGYAVAEGQQIPDCAVGTELWMVVVFPQCWDGVNLDSPDHKSHMAYP